MPEMRFDIAWPDGASEQCYAPSRVIQDYFSPGESYALADFMARAHTALNLASDRVQAKFGAPCGRALGQLARLQATATRHAQTPGASVTVLAFHA